MTTKHGYSKERLYNTWRQMMYRCTNPKSRTFIEYGQRNITVCQKWQSYPVFRKWAYDECGIKPTDAVRLRRRNWAIGYNEDNCFLEIDPRDNTERTIRTSNFTVTDLDGEKLTLSELGVKHSIPYNVVYQRLIISKWSLEDTLNTPVRHKFAAKDIDRRVIIGGTQ